MKNERNGFVHIKTVAEKVLKKMQDHGDTAWSMGGNGNTEITTGFAELDRNLGGFHAGGMYVIAARPGMGKTAFALRVVLNVLQNAKKPVYYFSNYLNAEELLLRLICIIGEIDTYSMRRGFLSDGEWESAANALSIISKTEFYVSHTLFPETDDIAAFIRDEVRDGLVVVDGIQEVCCNGNRPFHSKVMDMAQIAAVSRKFKLAAAEAGVPLLVTSQLASELERRKDKAPTLGDLETTVGIMGSDADGVLFLYREPYYYPTVKENDAEIILAKNRWGMVCRTTVGFDGRCARFYDI